MLIVLFVNIGRGFFEIIGYLCKCLLMYFDRMLCFLFLFFFVMKFLIFGYFLGFVLKIY